MTRPPSFPGAADLAADLARLPSASLAALKALTQAADAGEPVTAATLSAACAWAVTNPASTPPSPADLMEAHFSRVLAAEEQGGAQ